MKEKKIRKENQFFFPLCQQRRLHLAVNELGLTLCRFHLSKNITPACIQLTCSEHFQICRRDPQPVLHPQWICTYSHLGQKEVVHHYDLRLVLLSPKWPWKEKETTRWWKLIQHPLETSRNDWLKPAKDHKTGSSAALGHPSRPSMTLSWIFFFFHILTSCAVDTAG